jgi:hypothetical protein
MDVTPLELRAISRVTEDSSESRYSIYMVDSKGDQYQTVFSVYNNYRDGLERSMRRMRGLALRGEDVLVTGHEEQMAGEGEQEPNVE